MFGWAYMESTDWLDLFYKDWNLSHEHNLSISGGNENADYYVSGRFYDMDGIYRVGDESYKKYDLRAKGSLKIRPWFKVTNNTSLAIIDQHEPKHSRNNFAVQRAINHAAMPLSPPFRATPPSRREPPTATTTMSISATNSRPISTSSRRC